MVAAPVARGDQPVVNSDVDASELIVDEEGRARMHAEYARLKAEHDELEARLASLEADAARERRERPGPWVVFGLYGIAIVLSALWAWRWKGGRPS